jgi:deoxyadenosine/deoxycytidine kinase
MNLQQVKMEIESLGKTPAAEKMYPITSNWVPISDVLAIINRFEKHWKNYETHTGGPDRNLVAEIIGK